MLASILDVLFGCYHSNTSIPFTPNPFNRQRIKAAQPTGTYIVCLDCGKEFPYSLTDMKVVKPSFTIVRSQEEVA